MLNKRAPMPKANWINLIKNKPAKPLQDTKEATVKGEEKRRNGANAKDKPHTPNPEPNEGRPKQADPFLKNDAHRRNNERTDDEDDAVYSTYTADENGDYHVQNAGLILIHPFMTNLFRHCGLIDAKTLKLTEPEVCVHLLHFIATGKVNQPESNMLFEK
ncbi:hypothetical protein EON64_13065 [archaeon]|nr:MAG: hypothetical protein EON64_13065 [archaeon]